jgi:DNA-binding transcriptional regulator YhcF (GntR family)
MQGGRVIEEGRALFLQIAESVEDSIVEGSLAEESQAPSTNELASFYRINPATAAKGIAVLVDKGVLYKRRGIGMFVAAGARSVLLEERRTAFADRYVEPLVAEARKLGLGPEELSHLVRERATGAAASISEGRA